MSGKNLAATAAAVFAAGLLVAAESQAAGVKCVGANSCNLARPSTSLLLYS